MSLQCGWGGGFGLEGGELRCQGSLLSWKVMELRCANRCVERVIRGLIHQRSRFAVIMFGGSTEAIHLIAGFCLSDWLHYSWAILGFRCTDALCRVSCNRRPELYCMHALRAILFHFIMRTLCSSVVSYGDYFSFASDVCSIEHVPSTSIVNESSRIFTLAGRYSEQS